MRPYLCLFILSLLFPALPAQAAAVSQAEAATRLEALVPAYLEKVARTLRPNQANMAVRQEGDGFVASYFAVDFHRPEVDVSPGGRSGEYVGRVSYVVHEYRSRGKTEQQALNGPFRKVKSRRMREYTSFTQGQWAL